MVAGTAMQGRVVSRTEMQTASQIQLLVGKQRLSDQTSRHDPIVTTTPIPVGASGVRRLFAGELHAKGGDLDSSGSGTWIARPSVRSPLNHKIDWTADLSGSDSCSTPSGRPPLRLAAPIR
jgi:hypothetical protein